ncbi:MAG: ABC-2 type transport system ATP-binding protein [Gammaproteobacteria bacterium]|jgi:ABC-2 type transport system ATP-binding protein
MSALLEIIDLGKRFGSTVALANINLKIEHPAAIGLVGKNGAGKTTLLSILSGALRATTGSLSILGETPDSIATTGKLSILPQDATFKKGIPVSKQLVLFARLQGMTKLDAKKAVIDLLSELGDASVAEKYPESLSYGQRKRLGIVQAFLGKPQLVILDEPTAGLDPVVANDVRALIRKLSGESAFIISSHNLYEIEDICSSVIILDKGKLIASKPISELANKENKLNLTLNREPDSDLLSAFMLIPEVRAVSQVKREQEKITLDLGDGNIDELQIQVQRLIMDKNYVITDLSRGKTLIDGMMDLVDNK